MDTTTVYESELNSNFTKALVAFGKDSMNSTTLHAYMPQLLCISIWLPQWVYHNHTSISLALLCLYNSITKSEIS